MKKHIANIITSSRIIFSLPLLFIPLSSVWFTILYLFCGLTDMIDGTIARKTNSATQLGSKLDTVADFVFLMASIFKLLPTIHIPRWLWTWCGAIAVVKLGSIVWGYVSKKQFISFHTTMNKTTGLLLFLFPLTLPFLKAQYSVPLICAIATIAAIQEGFFIAKDQRR